MDDDRTIKLEKPIKIANPKNPMEALEIKELVLPEEITARHVKYFPKAWVNGGTQVLPEEVVPWISGIFGYEEYDIDKIGFKDLWKIVRRLNDFLSEMLGVKEGA